MSTNQFPQPPRQKKRRGFGKVYLICTLIALVGVLASGVVGYFGYTFAYRNNPAQSTVPSISTSESVNSAVIEAVDVTNVVELCRPSVVEITTEVVSSGGSIYGQYVSQGAGSGVIITSDGYIVTNNHVIADASSIVVTLINGQSYPATLVGTDAVTDVAVIKINANDLEPATFGNSDLITVGEVAIAIGNPLGSLGGTVTTGIISAVGRQITVENQIMTLLQTDAAINPGNSGGGLFNASGELIGIVNAKSYSSGIEGLGFAIPISDVTSIIEELIANGTVTSRPFLNVSLQDIGSSDIYSYFSDTTPGVYIAQIVDGGAADQAGLEVGDRIISIDGTEISSSAELKNELYSHSIGDTVEIAYERNGQTYTTDVVLKSSNGN